MKKQFGYLFLVLVVMISSCEKDPIISDDKNVGISRVTYYPVITLTGDDIITFENGSMFIDPGVKAIAGGAEVPVITSGSVNTDEDGIYTLTYSATNSDGFSSFATRKVVVYSTASDAAANDLSGTYLRPATGVSSTWTKIAPGVYKVFNPGGSAGTNLTIIAINPSAFIIDIPEQLGSDGSLTSSTDEVYTNSSPSTYSWKIVNPGYGPALRTFVKQ